MFLVSVRTLSGKDLTFKVKEYSIRGGFVCFEDRDKLIKKFPVSRTQIEEVN